MAPGAGPVVVKIDRKKAIVWLFQVSQIVPLNASLGAENDLEFAEGATASAGPITNCHLAEQLGTNELSEWAIY